jgi:hypothetical protein
MPDDSLVVPDVLIVGRWENREVRLAGELTLSPTGVSMNGSDGAQLVARYPQLTDATWRESTLTLHRTPDSLDVRGGATLAAAWARIVREACAAPEMARGLRALGTRRGGDADLQRRFFGPLLTARRQLEEPDAVERRLAQFDTASLIKRMQDNLAQLAADRFPTSPPHRRALEAHFAEATEPLFAILGTLDDAGDAVRNVADGTRFVAWRRWTWLLRRVFIEADRSWGKILVALDSV